MSRKSTQAPASRKPPAPPSSRRSSRRAIADTPIPYVPAPLTAEAIAVRLALGMAPDSTHAKVIEEIQGLDQLRAERRLAVERQVVVDGLALPSNGRTFLAGFLRTLDGELEPLGALFRAGVRDDGFDVERIGIAIDVIQKRIRLVLELDARTASVQRPASANAALAGEIREIVKKLDEVECGHVATVDPERDHLVALAARLEAAA
jgi:hypothetical protein